MRENLRNDLLLYAVTCDGAPIDLLERQVGEAIRGGATMIQLREKNLSEDEYLRKALVVRDVCREFDVPFIVDDAVDVAIRCGADGVHVGQEDMDAGSVRRLVGDSMIVGVSAKTVEQAVAAESAGADYLGTGAIYPTKTKVAPIMTDIDTLKAICSAVSIPVVAIGGIKAHNMASLAGSGIAGVSVVTGIFAAPDVREATAELRREAERLFK